MKVEELLQLWHSLARLAYVPPPPLLAALYQWVGWVRAAQGGRGGEGEGGRGRGRGRGEGYSGGWLGRQHGVPRAAACAPAAAAAAAAVGAATAPSCGLCVAPPPELLHRITAGIGLGALAGRSHAPARPAGTAQPKPRLVHTHTPVRRFRSKKRAVPAAFSAVAARVGDPACHPHPPALLAPCHHRHSGARLRGCSADTLSLLLWSASRLGPRPPEWWASLLLQVRWQARVCPGWWWLVCLWWWVGVCV